MEIRIINETETLSLEDLKRIATESHGDMAKAVVDIKRRILAVGGELHADAEQVLMEYGSTQENLWGINLYPDTPGENAIEYTSLINIKPQQGVKTMEITDEGVREQIREVVRLHIQNVL